MIATQLGDSKCMDYAQRVKKTKVWFIWAQYGYGNNKVNRLEEFNNYLFYYCNVHKLRTTNGLQ